MSFGIVGTGAGSTGGPGSSLYGESPETTWRNSVFKAKLMPLTDLGDRGIKPVNKVPTDDLLDDFKVGDLVGGIGKTDKQAHEGKISRIVKVSNGKGFRVFILNKEEKETEILPSSVVFIRDEDKNRRDMSAAADDQRDSTDRNRSAGQSYHNGAVPENKIQGRKLKHLLEFHEFRGDI